MGWTTHCAWVGIALLSTACSSSSGDHGTTDGGTGSDGTVDASHDAAGDGSGSADATGTDATNGADGSVSDGSFDARPPGDATSCTAGLSLCDGYCVNKGNDILNCGGCGTQCLDTYPYCDNGTCTTAPCTGSACGTGQFCCGTSCCSPGDLCCDVPSNLPTTPMCTTPVNGTCPVGCPVCP
jgi:hypothetical protein